MKHPLSLAVLCGLLVAAQAAVANDHQSHVLRQYPIPNAFEVPPVSNIGITASGEFDKHEIWEASVIHVAGSASGEHRVDLKLSDDRQTLILRPVRAFTYDETINVLVRARLADGSLLIDSFQFRTMKRPIEPGPLPTEFIALDDAEDAMMEDTLPAFNVKVDDGATPGVIYLANFGFGKVHNNNFMFNLTQHGSIMRQRNFGHASVLDFKVQPTGLITYFQNPPWRFYGVDTAWNVIDSFYSANGYFLDEHELRVFPDGGYALLAVSQTTLDSTQYVDGMIPSALIGGNVIQIFDAHGNETFEWRGIDHYRVSDAIHEKLTDSSIDFEHANSLDFDSAGNIIISNRHLCEITKIDGKTGATIWRLGGAHNQFHLIGDSVWFSYQHAARWLPNGHMMLFDNSNYDSVAGVPSYFHHTRVMEYAIDEKAMTATAVWQFHHEPETFAVAMGYAERLPNGNTFIGWGADSIAATEVRPDGSTAFELSFGPGNYSYRALKYPDPRMSVSARPQPASADALEIGMNANGGLNANLQLERPQQVVMQVLDALGRTVLPIASYDVTQSCDNVLIPTTALRGGSYYCVVRLEDGSTLMRPFAVAR